MISIRLAVAVLGALPPGVALIAGCGGGQEAGGEARTPTGAVSNVLSHEECNDSGNRVEALDLNGDGKPDIRRVFDKRSGRELCRIADLNRDGKPDLYEYFDGSGAVRRREFCYDDTGVVNAIEYYSNGKLTRREYDTMGQHKIDTWDWFDGAAPLDAKTGRPTHPARRERDTTGSGKVNQWWTWDGSKVTIVVDTNGDGKADPASTVVLGGDDKDKGPPSSTGPAGDGGPAVSASDAAAPASSGPSGGEGGAAAAVDGGRS